MARPNERSVAPQFIQPPMRPKRVAAASTSAYATNSGPKDCHNPSCEPSCDMRLKSAAKISGAATALARVPSTMAVQAPANAARSGCIWRQQYARVSLVEAFGKRVRSPMGFSSGEVQRAG